jgi:hypothetical protein
MIPDDCSVIESHDFFGLPRYKTISVPVAEVKILAHRVEVLHNVEVIYKHEPSSITGLKLLYEIGISFCFKGSHELRLDKSV